MPEYLSNKKRKQSIGINSYSEYTDTTKIIGNVLVGFGSVGVGTTIPTQDVDVQTIEFVILYMTILILVVSLDII
jgi:hypothetical protein